MPVDRDTNRVAFGGGSGGGGAVDSVNGHTGVVVLTPADIGLGNVDNTADSAKVLAESQVTNLVTDLQSVNSIAALNAAKIAAALAAASGFYVCQGALYSPSGTAGKLDRTAGVIALGTTDLFTSATTAIATTITTLASGLSAGQALWVNIEIDSAGATQFNSGAAATNPTIPDITAGRVIAGWIYIPFGATTVSASTSGTADAKLFDARVVNAKSPSGWTYDNTNTWVFVSATTGAGGGVGTYKIVGADATGYLPPGTLVGWSDANGIQFGVVARSAFSVDTTVTLIATSDYTLAAAGSITRARYSYNLVPQGFPTWFNWSPTLSGFTVTTASYQWKPQGGNSILVNIRQQTAGASSNATHTITAPVAAASLTNGAWGVITRATDNGTVQTGGVQIGSTSSSITCFGILATATNTGSGNANIFIGQFVYPF